jgi:hypothetical protein
MMLVDNAFNYSLLAERGFETLADVVDGLEARQLEYSDLDNAITALGRLTDGRSS